MFAVLRALVKDIREEFSTHPVKLMVQGSLFLTVLIGVCATPLALYVASQEPPPFTATSCQSARK